VVAFFLVTMATEAPTPAAIEQPHSDDSSPVMFTFFDAKGSRKNEFAILGVDAPAWQFAKMRKYLDNPRFRNAARWDASASKMKRYF
jgi:hypothetical protein